MSDYLWDKTGEPEEDVAQLENLLGALKYQPRPLNIPDGAMPAQALNPRPKATTTTIFSRPRLAIAASLVLMLLAGTWLVTHRTGPTTKQVVADGRDATSGNRQETAARAPATTDRAGGDDVSTDDARGLQSPRNERLILKASAPKRRSPSRLSLAKRQKSPPRVNAQSTERREELAAAREQEGREATEKVLLALRLASAKLNVAQRELQEISRVDK